MEKMRFESVDQAAENVEKIRALFPAAVTETLDIEKSTPEKKVYKKAVNFDMLRQLLENELVEGEERYELNWVGKKASVIEANTPIRKTLRPCVEESKNWETTGNLYIEGDNLDVLKLLQESYLGKVKMIYIDPPYNTGNDVMVYNDTFSVNREEYDEESGVYDEEGNRLFRNTNYNGRFHSAWCSMIYSRLLLAKNLLSKDGVVFISIDDNEQANLRRMCDEVFGDSNFVAQIVWEKVHTRKNSSLYFSASHEYIICYAKHKKEKSTDKEGFARNLLPRDDNKAYTNPDNDPKGPWKTDPITAHNYYSADYKITKPDGTVLSRPKDRYWAFSEETWKQKVAENAVVWGAKDSYPLLKRYLSEVKDGLVPTTIFSREFAGDTQQSKKDVDGILGPGIFEYTKPVKLLYRLIQLATSKDGDLVVDLFPGSATTAHAVMKLNGEDGGTRRFMMVQIPETTAEKSEAYQRSYHNVCQIGKDRIRLAGEKIKAGSGKHADKLDIGFRVFRLSSGNMKDVYYAAGDYTQTMLGEVISNIKEDRSDLDLLYGCLLEWGLPLSLPHKMEYQNGACLHTVNDGDEPDLIACFEENVSEEVIGEIARRRPLRAVFRDSSFPDSPARMNVEELFKLYAPTTKIKVI